MASSMPNSRYDPPASYPNSSSGSSRLWLLKCTDVPQFDALQAAADEFRYDEKRHLRNLCNDSSRCAGLTAVHLSQHQPRAQKSQYQHKQQPRTLTRSSSLDTAAAGVRKVILDYSRQQVTGETMELLFDLADAVGFLDRRDAFRMGERINIPEDMPVQHHILRMPKQYDFSSGGDAASMGATGAMGGGGMNYGGGGFGIGANGGGLEGSNHNRFSRSFGSLSDISGNLMPSPHSLQVNFPNAPPSGARPPPVFPEDEDSVLKAVHHVRDQIDAFARWVRSGKYVGSTGERLVHTLVVGGGGMDSGTKFVHDALQADAQAAEASEGRTLTFLSNVDPVSCYETTRELDPAKTLVVVLSKTFVSGETMLNARSVREWLVQNLATSPPSSSNSPQKSSPSSTGSLGSVGSLTHISDTQVVAQHMVAVSSNLTQCQAFGIVKANVFPIWDWVIGRYSVCSAAGLLPLALQYSPEIVDDMLQGAHNMDEHFFHAPLRDNLPVLLGLLGVWNSTFMGYPARAILPFAQSLQSFCSHVQQVDMESNGKRVALDGVPLLHPSGEVNFGSPGTNSHHSFFQLMHQGRVVPADFIGFMESQRPIDLPGEAVSSHDEYMSNFFAQPDALAYGKTLADLRQEGVPDELREHMVFTGNRPSLSILFTRLDAYSVGQLLALYEHRATTQGFVWGINSFDQYGIELGKQMAKHVRAQLSASRRTGASVQGFNLSTSSLLEAYLAHGK